MPLDKGTLEFNSFTTLGDNGSNTSLFPSAAAQRCLLQPGLFPIARHLLDRSESSSQETPSIVEDTCPTSPSTLSPSSPTASNSITCTWASCDKIFLTRSEYSHHSKNHLRPFLCTSCPARHATKRQLNRHINEKHDTTEKYYYTVSTCKRSLAKQGKPFPRDDGCRKHMRRVHRMTDEQVKECGMDERTRMIRWERKVG